MPFGLPVEPDVYSRNNGCSAFTQTGSHTANSAVRELSVGKCTANNGADLLAFVTSELGSSAKSGTITATPQYFMSDGSNAADAAAVDVGGTVKLTIAFDTVNLHFPLLPYLSDGKVTRVVDARVEYVPQAGCAA